MTAAALEDRVARLKAFYGPQPSPPRDPFALYVWEVLNMHAAPMKRDAALAALRRIPALTPDSVWKTPLPKLEAALGLAGPYVDERVRALRAGADVFRRDPGMARAVTTSLLGGLRALKRLPSLGRAGSYRMLLFAAGRPVVPVSPALARTAMRLGYGTDEGAAGRQARSVRRALERVLPADLDARRRALLMLEHHAQSTCLEHDPHCHVCPLAPDCPEGQKRTAGPS